MFAKNNLRITIKANKKVNFLDVTLDFNTEVQALFEAYNHSALCPQQI